MSAQRPHVFVAELGMYVNHLKEQLTETAGKLLDKKRQKYFDEYYKNLMNGIDYYRHLTDVAKNSKDKFIQAIEAAEHELKDVYFSYFPQVSLV